MRKLFFVWLLLCTGLLAGCAGDRKISQPAQLPQERCDLPIWERGDYWVYRLEGGQEFGWRVEDVTEKLYVVGFSSNKERRLAFDRNTLELGEYAGSKDRKMPSERDDSLFFKFPIFVGKKWDRMIFGDTTRLRTWNYLMSYRVLSLEEVQVPAGTFKAFKIEQNQKELAAGGEAISYLWFSEEVKNVIKFSFGTSHGAWIIKSQDYELISYKAGKSRGEENRLNKPLPLRRGETERGGAP